MILMLTVVDDVNDRIESVRAISTIKFAAIASGVVMSLACGGLFMSKDSLIHRDVFLLNLANGAGPIGTRMNDGTITPIPGPQDVPFGEISSEFDAAVSEYDLSARVYGMTSPYEATSSSVRASSPSLIVAMCPPSGPTCEFLPIVYNALPTMVFYKDGAFGGATSIDIYVTAPGASIASVAPDGTLTQNGVGLKLPSALHANTAYQVRFCAAGTKTVLLDTGTRAAVGFGDYAVYALYHNATTELWKSVTIRSDIDGM